MEWLLTILAVLFFVALVVTIAVVMRGRDAAKREEDPDYEDKV